MQLLDQISSELSDVSPVIVKGRVLEVNGPIIRASLSGAAVGSMALVKTRRRVSSGDTNPHEDLLAKVVGFSNQIAVLSPFGSTEGIYPGALVSLSAHKPSITLGGHLLGASVDGLGNILSSTQADTYEGVFSEPGKSSFADAPESKAEQSRYNLHALQHLGACQGSLFNAPPEPLSRKPIEQTFVTGIRAIDAFTTVGQGQRLSVFSEPGVGKSTLLAMIASNSSADVNVIGLVGERGREVNELLLETLDEETRQRTVVVVSTSDQAAILRLTAAVTATRIAEYFRDQGLNVLLQIDSLTRLFRAYREVGLAAGEMPVRQGYPASAFSELPRLIERTGTSSKGSITALYTVLLSSDFNEDPMVEEVKGLTDGHLVLSRNLADKGHYPAIDVLSSISRLQKKLLPAHSYRAAQNVRRLMARLQNDKDLALLGSASDAELNLAMSLESEISALLRQDPTSPSPLKETLNWLDELSSRAEFLQE